VISCKGGPHLRGRIRLHNNRLNALAFCDPRNEEVTGKPPILPKVTGTAGKALLDKITLP